MKSLKLDGTFTDFHPNLKGAEKVASLGQEHLKYLSESMGASNPPPGLKASGACSRSSIIVALMLGYAEAGAFGRAFRRWYGISPAAYRRQVRVVRKSPSKELRPPREIGGSVEGPSPIDRKWRSVAAMDHGPARHVA